jgi:long-chain acyl-CoA synthetase
MSSARYRRYGASTLRVVTWTVIGTLRDGARNTPDAPMLTGPDSQRAITTRSWREVDERSNRVAQGLAAEGVGSGDRVAILDKNGLAFYDVLFGGAKLNAVNVAVNWRLAAPEMAQIINDSNAKLLVVGDEFLPQLAAFEDQLVGVRRILIAGSGHPKHADLDTWMSSYDAVDPAVAVEGSDVAVQFYTSGTTGLPKGVMLTNDNLGAGLSGMAEELDMHGDCINMAAMPLFHIGGSGWAMASMAVGGHTVLVRDVDPSLILSTIQQQGITHAFLVPAVLQFMLSVPGVNDIDMSTMRSMVYGASPISDDVLARCIATFGCPFVQLYGMTETTGAITILRPKDHERPHLLRSCGRPLPGNEIRVVDPATGLDQSVGEVGEVWCRSPQNMRGYYGKPEDTAKTIDGEGWLRTGDAGYFDDEGFLFLHDRIKDMIVSGGENVYPAEIENVLMSHPGVADAAAIGVPDPKWGESIKAIVVAGDPRPDPAELIAFCRERLAHFKCPRSVDFIDALPRNPSGKILKRELRAPYWQGTERNIS